MSTHDEIRTLIEDMQAGSKGWERESAARLKALNEQCDKLLAVIDAVQDGVKALDSADDGWIPWGGGKCPVATSVNVRIKLRDGESTSDKAGYFYWTHRWDEADIIAYKVED